ncbi:chaplin family protein [Catenulispora yoronensis]
MLSAATGAVVLGGAAAASAATSATVTGSTADSPGAVAGNTVQVPADVPIQVCGDTAAAAAALDGAFGNVCAITGASADAAGFAAHSPGAVSGNVASVAADVPVQACGLDAAAVAAGIRSDRNACLVDGTSAHAVGAAADSPACSPATWSSSRSTPRYRPAATRWRWSASPTRRPATPA